MAAAIPEISFNALLHADSEQVLPEDDAGVIAALHTYGVVFKGTRGAANADNRIDLLAGIMWIHCHIGDISTVLANASVAQQRRLATALRLDYDTDSKLEAWPTLVARRVLSNARPGSTPTKRKFPSPDANSQIVVPGFQAKPAADGAGAPL
jgi:hypothetical protein